MRGREVNMIQSSFSENRSVFFRVLSDDQIWEIKRAAFDILEKTGAKVDISDDGTVKVASSDGKSIEAALNWIKSIVQEPEVGEIYQGTVVKTVDFGAFVNFFGAKDGLVHISQLAPSRVAKTTDVVKEGDKVWVKLLGFDDRGKVRLSMKVVDQETGDEITPDKVEAAASAESAS